MWSTLANIIKNRKGKMMSRKICDWCKSTEGVKPIPVVKGGVENEVAYLCAWCRKDKRYKSVKHKLHHLMVYGDPNNSSK